MEITPDKQVFVFAGGGLGPVSGGVGTLMRYLMGAWARDASNLKVRVVDTRGAGGTASAAWHFAAALASLLGGRLSGRIACAHIHMTTRGSALRKSLLCLLANRLGVPVVLHLHGADFFDFYARLPRWGQTALRRCVARARCIVVIGQTWRDRLVRELGVEPSRVRVVLNGVPAAPARDEAEGPARILFLGRLGARKGVADLITALGAYQVRRLAWTAVIAGDGDASPFLTQIGEAGLRARIDMPGWLSHAETAEALAASDILVLPSYHEVMPMAILEAMARGLAIVATPVGAVPEILEDGVNARLVPVGAPARLAEALAELIHAREMRQALGRRARQDFAARLDIAIPAAELQSIYASLAA